MSTLDHIVKKYKLNLEQRLPIQFFGDRDVDFPELFRELKFTKGVEIGVEQGTYSETLLSGVPDLTLYGIDPWLAYPNYREYVSQEQLNGFYEKTLKRLDKYDFRAVRDYSENAHKFFKDGELDFVYIDGNHEFFYVAQDLHHWAPKVRAGGIVAGHDYRRNSAGYVNDVKDIVPGYMYAKKIRPWFVLREQHGPSSWFWVKQ